MTSMSDIAAAALSVAAARQTLAAATNEYKEDAKSGDPFLTEVAKERVLLCLDDCKSAQKFLAATREAASRALLQQVPANREAAIREATDRAFILLANDGGRKAHGTGARNGDGST